jgi:hypothetical protein
MPPGSSRYKFRYCPIHEIFWVRSYPHQCDGIRTLPERAALHGVKRLKRGPKKDATGTAAAKKGRG